uniref:Uncharacterized protein n=1 Tax=Megaviridae environmental sample TaxID=1737588 RepID=A0A5J6VJM2_9VIRU|nr:MAG: hypothetical protein [Megaviridae environmental sample]
MFTRKKFDQEYYDSRVKENDKRINYIMNQHPSFNAESCLPEPGTNVGLRNYAWCDDLIDNENYLNNYGVPIASHTMDEHPDDFDNAKQRHDRINEKTSTFCGIDPDVALAPQYSILNDPKQREMTTLAHTFHSLPIDLQSIAVANRPISMNSKDLALEQYEEYMKNRTVTPLDQMAFLPTPDNVKTDSCVDLRMCNDEIKVLP